MLYKTLNVLKQNCENAFVPIDCSSDFVFYDSDVAEVKFSYKGEGALFVRCKEDITRALELTEMFNSFESNYLPKDAVMVYGSPYMYEKHIWKFDAVNLVDLLDFFLNNNLECFALVVTESYEG